ncbi:hypothetical protein EMIT0196MI5_20273 [Pseudomonas sp. IT-196MI5]
MPDSARGWFRSQTRPTHRRALANADNPVGAAEGCDLLILKVKVKRSQPSAAPTQSSYGTTVTGFYSLLQVGDAVSQDCATRQQESTNETGIAALNL